MPKIHFTYWTNNDIIAFILNTLNYESEEISGKFADSFNLLLLSK